MKFAAAVLIPLSLGLGGAALSSPQSSAATNPITVENANQGTSLPSVDQATIGQITGYASSQSVNSGGSIALHLSSTIGPVDLKVFRLGWYGGARSRKMFSVNGVAASARPTPGPDAFGRVEAAWPASYNLTTAANWASGVYVVGLFKAGASAPSGLVTFVVRNDASASSFVYVLPMATYEAYNGWGGKSLYGYNSTGGVSARKVSFDRPFDSGAGAGLLFEGDAYMVNFLEQEGYDVAYAASSDLNDNPGLLSNHRAFLSSFHDEYWSAGMRSTLENAVAAGTHAAFFGANSMYWQVRFESSTDGRASRTMVGYKDSASLDPVQGPTTTGRWRDAPINRPENAFLGSQYEGDFAYGNSVPWVVANASHWMYNGTGLANGDQIPKLVGYEWDRTFDNGQSPAGLVTLSQSNPRAGALQQATIHQKGGALVFNASTIYWPLLLANASWGIDSRVQIMTRNLLNAMIDPAGPPTTTVPPTTTTAPNTSVPPTTPTAPNTDTIVTRWDFEDGTTQGWTTWYGTGTVTPVATGAHSGTRAIRTTPGGYAVLVNASRNLTPGHTYRFNAYLRHDAPTFASGLVQFYTSTGTSAAPDLSMVVGSDPTGQWKTLSATFVMPANASTVQWGINGGEQVMVFDDATVTAPVVTTLSPTTAPVVTTLSCSIRYAPSWDSGAGFGADVTVTNYGPPGENWTLMWTYPNDQLVMGSYGGNATQSGKTVTFTNAAWNGGIGNGSSADVGVGGTYTTGNTAPSAFRFNGTLCSSTTVVATTAPLTATVPPATVPLTTVPLTTVPLTTVPLTTVPPASVPLTTTVPPATTDVPGAVVAGWTFEDGRTTGWTGKSLSVVSSARTGARALRSPKGSLVLSLNSFDVAGRVNRVTAWVQSTSTPTAEIRVSGPLNPPRIPATIEAPVNGWRRVTVSYTPSSLTTATFVLGSSGAVIVDDVELRV